MISVAWATEEIIKQSPFLEEALAQDLLNVSSFARFIQTKVKQKVKKAVQIGAIVMALKRMQNKIHVHPSYTSLLRKLGDITVRSNLFEITFANSVNIKEKLKNLFYRISQRPNTFCNLSQGVFETTIIAQKELKKDIQAIFKNEKMISIFDDLSSISIKLPFETVDTPGVYYTLLKLLAWDGVNVVEVVSTYTEFTIIFNDKDVDKAFSLLKQSLKSA